MSETVWAILGASIVLVLWLGVRKNIRHGRIEVNHEVLFALGVLFYWLFPVMVGLAGWFESYPAMDRWYGYFETVNPFKLSIYLMVVVLLFISFSLGSSAGRSKVTELYRPRLRLGFNENFLVIFLIAALFPAIYFVWHFKGLFFTGYQELDWYDASQKGQFVATANLALAIAWIGVLSKAHRLPSAPLLRLLFNKYVLFYLILAILIVSLGGRLYFVSSLVMVLVFLSVYRSPISLGKVGVFAFVFSLLLGLLAVWRMGASFAWDLAVFLFSAESIYTAFSLFSYLGSNEIHILSAPIFLLSGLASLVPTFIYPEKGALLLNPEDYGFFFISPVGATNSFVSLNMNFGLLGGAITLFLFGFFLSRLRYHGSSLLSSVLYIMLCGFLPFTFFRDDYSISIVKNLFQFSFLAPVLLVVTMHLLSSKYLRAKAAT